MTLKCDKKWISSEASSFVPPQIEFFLCFHIRCGDFIRTQVQSRIVWDGIFSEYESGAETASLTPSLVIRYHFVISFGLLNIYQFIGRNVSFIKFVPVCLVFESNWEKLMRDAQMGRVRERWEVERREKKSMRETTSITHTPK